MRSTVTIKNTMRSNWKGIKEEITSTYLVLLFLKNHLNIQKISEGRTRKIQERKNRKTIEKLSIDWKQ